MSEYIEESIISCIGSGVPNIESTLSFEVTPASMSNYPGLMTIQDIELSIRGRSS
jgi:hypothetical protein